MIKYKERIGDLGGLMPFLTVFFLVTLALPCSAQTSSPTPSSASTSAAPAGDIRDIQGVISIPYEWLWAAYILAGLIVAGLAYVAWRYFCSRVKTRAKLPYEIALEKLEAARPLMTTETVREYAFAVSEIIRVYIEHRFGEKAARRTTEEFLADLLRQTGTPLAQHSSGLQDFLNHCDLIKFARWGATEQELESMHESARAFIFDTRPQPVVSSPARTGLPPQPELAPRQMIHFLHPQFLALLLLLPVVAFWLGRRGRVAAVEYSSASVVREVARETRSRAGRLLVLLPLLAAALFIIGLARPQLQQGSSEVQASGVDLMLAIDVSGSMQSLDYQVNGQPTSRVDTVKAAVAKFVDARPDDRLGLIEFSAEPYLISPLTLDHDWLRQGLDRVDTGTIADGTAIGDALAMCVNRLRDQPSKSKVIVLLTDGVNNMGRLSPLLAAEAAKALGIKVYTIGAGVRGNAPMPVKDNFGNTHIVMVPSDVDEDTLTKMAQMTGGQFFRATDTEKLDDTYAQIDRMEKTTRTIKHYDHVSELFAWTLVPGLLVLGTTFWLEQTRFRRLP